MPLPHSDAQRHCPSSDWSPQWPLKQTFPLTPSISDQTRQTNPLINVSTFRRKRKPTRERMICTTLEKRKVFCHEKDCREKFLTDDRWKTGQERIGHSLWDLHDGHLRNTRRDVVQRPRGQINQLQWCHKWCRWAAKRADRFSTRKEMEKEVWCTTTSTFWTVHICCVDKFWFVGRGRPVCDLRRLWE